METVDALDIEISSSVQNINDSIEMLSKKLTVFSESLKSVDTGKLQEMASAIRSLSDGLKGTEEIEVSGVAGVVDLLSELGSEIATAGVENLLKMKDSLVQFVFNMNSIGGVTFDVSGISDLLEAISEFGDKSATTGVENLLKIRDSLVQFVFNMNSIGDVMFDASGLSALLETILELGDESATTGVENLLEMKDNLVQFVSNMNAVEGMKFDVSSFSNLLGAISKLGDESISNTIKNIPKVAKEMQNFMQTLSAAPDVSANVVNITSALTQLASQGNKVEVMGTHAPSENQNKSSKSSGKISKSLSGMMGKLYTNVTKTFQKAKELWSSIESSFDYLEVLNYFDETFGQVASGADLSSYKEMGYDSAEAYYNSFEKRAKELTAKMSGFTVGENGIMQKTEGANLGLDPTQVMKYQAMFARMSSSMGVTSENALKLSQSLIEIGADLASAKGVGFEDVWEDIASGFAGTGEALEKYGVDLRDAALQQKLMELGLDASVSALDQNDKALLRAIVLLDSTKSAWGNLVDAINQPANQLHLIQENFQSLSKTIGSFFLPLVQKVLPYVNALVITFQRLFSWLGNLLGIDLSGISTAIGDTNLGNVQEQTDKLENSLGDAKKSSDKLNRSLRQFDELKTITMKENSDTDSSDTKEIGGGLLDKAFLDTYEKYQGNWDSAFANLENSALKIADKIEKAFEPVKKIIQDFIIGDFFQAGKDTSHLVAGIFDVFADAIDKVNWNGIGQKIGDFIVGIDWFSIFTSVVKVIWEAFKGVLEAYVGAFISAPFETTLTTLAVAPGILETITSSKYITDFKKLGNTAKDCFWAIGAGFKDKEIGNGFATALEEIGKNLSPFQKFSIGALGVTGEFSLIKDGFYDLTAGSDNVVKSLGEIVGGAGLAVGALKLIGLSNPWTAAIVGATGIIGALLGIKQAQKDVLEELDRTQELDVFGDSVENLTKKWDGNAQAIRDRIKASKEYVEDCGIKEAQMAQDLADRYFELSKKENLTNEEMGEMKTLAKLLLETLPDLEQYYNQETGYIDITKEALDKLINNKLKTIKLNAIEEKLTEAYKDRTDAMFDLEEAAKKLHAGQEKIQNLNADYKEQESLLNVLKEYNGMQDQITKTIKTSQEQYSYLNGSTIGLSDETLKLIERQKELKDILANAGIDAESSKSFGKIAEEMQKIRTEIDSFQGENVKIMVSFSDYEQSFQEIEKHISELTSIWGEVTELGMEASEYAKEINEYISEASKVAKNEGHGTGYLYAEGIKSGTEKAIEKNDISKTTEKHSKSEADGYIEGLRKHSKSLNSSIKEMVAGGLETWQNTQQSYLPSKVTKEYGKDAEDGYALGIESNVGDTSNGVSVYVDKVPDKFSEIVGPMRKVSINAMQGLFDGLASMENNIYSKAGEIADNVAKTVKNTLEIHSPSRVMFQLGDYTMQGFQEGLENLQQPILRSMKDFSYEIVATPLPGFSDAYVQHDYVASSTISQNGVLEYQKNGYSQRYGETNRLLREQNNLLKAILEKPNLSNGDIFNAAQKIYKGEATRRFGNSDVFDPVWG